MFKRINVPPECLVTNLLDRTRSHTIPAIRENWKTGRVVRICNLGLAGLSAAVNKTWTFFSRSDGERIENGELTVCPLSHPDVSTTLIKRSNQGNRRKKPNEARIVTM